MHFPTVTTYTILVFSIELLCSRRVALCARAVPRLVFKPLFIRLNVVVSGGSCKPFTFSVLFDTKLLRPLSTVFSGRQIWIVIRCRHVLVTHPLNKGFILLIGVAGIYQTIAFGQLTNIWTL